MNLIVEKCAFNTTKCRFCDNTNLKYIGSASEDTTHPFDGKATLYKMCNTCGRMMYITVEGATESEKMKAEKMLNTAWKER